ncbi:MAG: dolichol-phosphate mannosyltransferase [Rickettsiales bacterium]|nr:dolichol-phosphate mannosyltransferase [Rickettsiales bacterium]|tara:strand:- start:641 stop:1336 length:696 start_codon:yes stop_codon:yes gene_type:complete
MNNFSIIIPIFNESECVFMLVDEIQKEFGLQKPEIVIVDDGSNDDFRKKENLLSQKKINVFYHSQNLGKSKAMETGIRKSKNDLICVMDGDGQNPPYEIKKFIDMWKKLSKTDKIFGLICGNRIHRKDTLLKKFSSLIANKLRKLLLNDDCDDTACAFKLFRRQDYLKIKYFKNMHRFLPALFKMHGGKIFNIMVNDRKRFGGKSKFNFNNRFWIGIIDLAKVWILIHKRR